MAFESLTRVCDFYQKTFSDIFNLPSWKQVFEIFDWSYDHEEDDIYFRCQDTGYLLTRYTVNTHTAPLFQHTYKDIISLHKSDYGYFERNQITELLKALCINVFYYYNLQSFNWCFIEKFSFRKDIYGAAYDNIFGYEGDERTYLHVSFIKDRSNDKLYREVRIYFAPDKYSQSIRRNFEKFLDKCHENTSFVRKTLEPHIRNRVFSSAKAKCKDCEESPLPPRKVRPKRDCEQCKDIIDAKKRCRHCREYLRTYDLFRKYIPTQIELDKHGFTCCNPDSFATCENPEHPRFQCTRCRSRVDNNPECTFCNTLPSFKCVFCKRSSKYRRSYTDRCLIVHRFCTFCGVGSYMYTKEELKERRIRRQHYIANEEARLKPFEKISRPKKKRQPAKGPSTKIKRQKFVRNQYRRK